MKPGPRFLWLGAASITAMLAFAEQSRVVAQTTPDVRALSDRIERLQRDVDVLQRSVARGGGGSAAAPLASGGGPPSQGYIAQTDQRFSDMDQQLRDITNRLEEMSFQVREMSARLDKLVGDVDFRLSQLERSGGAGGPAGAPPGRSGAAPGATSSAVAATTPSRAASPPPRGAQLEPGETQVVLVPGGPSAQGAMPSGAQPTAGAPAAGAIRLPDGTPEAQYEYAYGLVRKAQLESGDFASAEDALRQFLTAHSTHRLAGNAQYWLGETYFVRRDYQQSAAAFAEGFKRYPNSEKAPDNLLKLGMSLGNLKRAREACGTFGELERRYPQASVTIKQTMAREKQRLNCA
ncbi:MAG TPA: tol-pal system protein YbgF [Alphaproteobacteria bacterium]|nr:tol-pal system protein YbgF [Alphaproteobacteria bacterium]